MFYALKSGEELFRPNDPRLVELLENDRLSVAAMCDYVALVRDTYRGLIEDSEQHRELVREARERNTDPEAFNPKTLAEFYSYKVSEHILTPIADILTQKLTSFTQRGCHPTASVALRQLQKTRQMFSKEIAIEI